VLAILGGLGAAVCWAAGTVSAARASRLIGAQAVVAWMMVVGLLLTLPPALARGVPDALGGSRLVWFFVAGAGNIAGVLLAYEAMRGGKVSIVAPITSSEGVIAAVLAVATGETLGASSAVLLVVVACGVVVASRQPSGDASHPLRSTLLAAGAAWLFGLSLFATARVSDALPIAWAVLPPRLVGVAAVSLPLLAARQLRLPGSAWPLVLLSGCCEVLGFASYAEGSRHGIAVSAVLASQFAALTAVGAFVVFKERLARPQLAGVAAIAIGVSVLSALQA
jgi:drug/metabolite transporter (DMT)-like permease